MTIVTDETPLTTVPKHLNYLDGIRAIAALWVMLFHLTPDTLTPHILRPLGAIIRCGYLAVPIFIVLSGYSLMLPVLRGQGQLSGGFRGFMLRRCRRILPAYYAAMVASIAAFGGWDLINNVLHRHAKNWETYGYGLWNVVTHTLMIHNLFPEYRMKIDYPMWSVGTEMDIYVLFPIVLLPLWRRFGIWAPVLVSFAFTTILQWAAPNMFGYLCTWYIGLFAAGMAAASMEYSSRPSDIKYQKLVSGVWTPAVLALLLAYTFRNENLSWQKEIFLGLFAAWFIFKLSSSAAFSRAAIWLSGPILAKLARISYSLYLTHFFVASVARAFAPHLSRHPTIGYFGILVVGSSACIGVASVFSRLFEYPNFLYKARTEPTVV